MRPPLRLVKVERVIPRPLATQGGNNEVVIVLLVLGLLFVASLSKSEG